MPENRLAQAAVQRVIDCLCAGGCHRELNPLFLHGPAGTGKTHLAAALVDEVTRRCPDRVVCVVAAGEWMPLGSNGHPQDEDRPDLTGCDLLVVEDLQHLSDRSAPDLVRVFDHRLPRQLQMVFTASAGPGQLSRLPARLTARLAGGLVVGLGPLSTASRLVFLQDRARRRGLAAADEVLAWLSENTRGSARQLEGVLNRIEALARLQGRVPDLATVAEQFRTEAEASRPSIERIIERVGRYYQVEPGLLCSRTRGRNALLPRQVGMYLARMLTPLSLGAIGARFGGRDHSTVLHACRKVEQALARDAALSGAVRQLHADLG
jgi:chromosomal replication initiator protein